jgi:hypothetical protein
VKALLGLKKAKFEGYVNDPSPPGWLERAIGILSKTDKELKELPPIVSNVVFCGG